MDRCNLCGSNELEFLFEAKDMMHGLKGKFKLYKCRKCGLVFLNPQPDVSKYYPKDYYSLKIKKFNPENIIYYFYYKYKPTHILLKPLKKLLQFRDLMPIKNKRILDIGCGYGKFLLVMKKLGVECYGIEPGKINKKLAEELNITNGELYDAKFPDDFFDTITMRHSLEHVNDPLKTLKEVKRILKPKGELIIEVPNIDSTLYKKFGKYWIHFDAPRHLFDFSDKTLRMYIKKAGFKIKRIKRFSYPYSLLTSIRYKKGKKGIVANKFLNVIALPVTFFIDIFGKGDVIETVLEK